MYFIVRYVSIVWYRTNRKKFEQVTGRIVYQFSRREIVTVSLAAFGGLALALPYFVRRAQRANGSDKINWDSFINSVEKEAESQFSANWDQREYVNRVGKIFSTLDLNDPVLVEGLAQPAPSQNGFPNIRDFYFNTKRSFQISLLTFETGDTIGLHNHPGMTGITLCASGNAVIQNYNLISKQGVDRTWILQRSIDERAARGDMSVFTSDDSNIHHITAAEPTQILDIFTPPYTPQREQDTVWFQIEEENPGGRDDLLRVSPSGNAEGI